MRSIGGVLTGLVSEPGGYDLVLPADSVHNGLPSGTATLIVNLDEPMSVRWPGADSERFQVLVGGLHTRPAEILTHGRQYGIQFALPPAGVRALFGVPIGALVHSLAEPADVTATDSSVRREIWTSFAERLAAEPTWERRYAVAEQMLTNIARATGHSTGASPTLTGVWQRIHARRGRVDVAALAAASGYSRRHLSTLFRVEFGVSIKQACRLARFEYARDIAARRGLAAAASEAGYSDQAHLTRDWGALGGRSPRALLDEPFYVPATSSAPPNCSRRTSADRS
ncbi:MAG: helix-turn-helix domain-containing protein [Acidimicrobiales bacterium]